MSGKDGFVDLGKKSEGPMTASPGASSKDKKYYPDFYFSGDKLPEMEIGDVEFTGRGRVVSINERKSDRGDKKEECSYSIEVHEIKLDKFVKDNDRDKEEDGGERLDKALDKMGEEKSKKAKKEEKE